MAPWGGSAPNQTYTRSDGVRTGTAVNVTAKNNGVNDTAALADARENDFATALNLVWKRDGGNQPSANIPMNSFKFTGMGAGSARTDSIRMGQVQDGAATYAEAAGTANAIELSTTPTCSPVEGMVIGFVAEADSSSTVTVDLNGSGAVALQVGGAALAGGEINNGQFHFIGFDGTQWQLLNPHVSGNYQPLDADLTAIAALAKTDGNIIVGDGATWVAESGATARASLGLTIGTHVQAYDALLASIAGLTFGSDNFVYGTGSDTAAAGTITSFGRSLVDDADASEGRTTLGLGTGDSPQFAAVNIGNSSDTTITRSGAGDIAVEGNAIYRAGGADVPVADGGTGASSARAACLNLSSWHVLTSVGSSQSHTGNTAETTLATVSVPANAMGANGSLRITIFWSGTLGPNDKTLRVKFGGTTLFSQTETNISAQKNQLHLINRNSTSSQIMLRLFDSTGNAPTSSIDTTSSQNILITGQLESGADTITLEAYVVELVNAS